MLVRLVRNIVPALVPMPLLVGLAMAQTSNINRPNPNLLQFPNVSVVNAPQAASRPLAGLQAGKVHVDEAGKIKTPAPGEDRDLSDQLKALLEGSPTSSTPLQLPNGALGVALGSEALNLSVVSVNPEGTLSWECVKLGDLVQRPAAAPVKTDARKEARHAK